MCGGHSVLKPEVMDSSVLASAAMTLTTLPSYQFGQLMERDTWKSKVRSDVFDCKDWVSLPEADPALPATPGIARHAPVPSQIHPLTSRSPERLLQRHLRTLRNTPHAVWHLQIVPLRGLHCSSSRSDNFPYYAHMEYMVTGMSYGEVGLQSYGGVALHQAINFRVGGRSSRPRVNVGVPVNQ